VYVFILLESMPSATEMQAIAAEVGFSETAFAVPLENAEGKLDSKASNWRVRYFSPETEVPFCGHATIALGTVLARVNGPKIYKLTLNDADITVEGFTENGLYSAALQSPPSRHAPASNELLRQALELMGLAKEQLSDTINPAVVSAGMNHLLLPLNSRADLATMNYDLDTGKQLMQQHDLATIMLVVKESSDLFSARNAFASGGVLEDPATGAAAAAFVGYLRDNKLTELTSITLIQGEDMGARSVINTEFTSEIGESIRVLGTAYELVEQDNCNT